MFRSFITAASVLAALSGSAQSQQRVEAGAMSCDVSAGSGSSTGPQPDVACTFSPAGLGSVEYYTGKISKLGGDTGVTTGDGVAVWLVWAPTDRPVGALTGPYAASGDPSVIAGLGANALVGGFNRTIALQPFSVPGQVGLNIAASVAGIELHFVR